MKRILFSLLVLLVVLFTAAACNNTGSDAATENDELVTDTTESKDTTIHVNPENFSDPH